MSSSRLTATALTCLSAFGLLALAVAHGRQPYGFEDPVFTWLGVPSTTVHWADLSKGLSLFPVGIVLAVSVAIGVARHTFSRVVAYAAFAAVGLLLSEEVFKPLVHRYFYGELTFPSGSVTVVCGTALAMWLALHPVLGRRTRTLAFVIGSLWVLGVALAVVGALWHTPLDDVGSILLSTGIVTGGAALFEHVTNRRGQAASASTMVGHGG